MRVLGVDGWRGHWVCALWDEDAPGHLLRWEVADDARAVQELADREGCRAVAVDVPQGLPRAGSRAADREARARVGRRASSVYPALPRLVLGLEDHAEACRVLRATGENAVSVQAFGLRHAIRQWDELLVVDPARQARVAEVHPEVSFTRLAGPGLESKRSALGTGQRIRALARLVPHLVEGLAGAPAGPALDDVLDAAVAAWSAARFAHGAHETLPVDPPRDERGLLMRVVV